MTRTSLNETVILGHIAADYCDRQGPNRIDISEMAGILVHVSCFLDTVMHYAQRKNPIV